MSSPQPSRVGSGFNELRVATALRHVALIGVAGVTAGLLVGGIGGRIFMRLSAMIAPERAVGAFTENGNVIGDITVGGTVAFVLFIGVFAGGFGAVIYTISEPWLAWAGPMRGIVFGVFLLATGSTVVFDPENFDFAILGNDWRNVLMLIVLYLAFGPVLVALIGVLEKRLPAVNPEKPIDSIPGYIALIFVGVLFLVLLLGNLFLEDFCECEPPRVMGVLIVGMVVGTVAWWVSRIREPERETDRWVSVLGYVTTAGAFAAGALRAISDVRQLL